ncbi:MULTISPECIES: serine/threonine protein kinase [Vibrio]|uniref:serine/threonine protein kinase n=1 Tax=Vibrio TaxID=662 RepID=UPI0002C4911C|nr:protein kinase [Vibrio harveyi]MCG7515390.1 protein kinase [Vibrio sp. MMH1-50]EKO3798698.1 protein kinase [Vibrio harveyi]EKO3828476.1 protein kinase [Vibrio harveyi]EKO3860358.1 protein kinase [Vibrio harveyi]EKO3864815.1 protein kinase [Vibrio harveyi]
MSDKQGAAKGYIDQLVVKAIEKKKQNEQRLAQKNKPKLEYVLFSQFDVLDTLLSKNGRTTVYHLAKKGQPEKQICCKVVNEDAPDIANKMLVNEASRLELSQHPSVADFIKIGNEFERPYLMYEWIQGESLAEKMERHSSKGFRHDHIAWLVYQLAGALEFMHTRGICHLDIKPSNVLVSEGDYVKLIDFGAARYIGENESHAEASLSYASPLYLETGTTEPQDDVYSLALLTGHLFIGSIFGDAWHKQLKDRKRPALIPNHIWKLLKQVINNPRGHGYTAISFAQQLARIDTQSIDSQSNAPIFSSLRNADLLLTHCKPQDKASYGRFKVLEASLVLSVVAVTGHYLYQQNQPEWKTIVKSQPISQTETPLVSTIKPAQTASFLAQPPWAIETALNDMEKDVISTAPYREAYQVQQMKLSKLYKKNQTQLTSYQALADELPKTLVDLRKELVTLREKLVDDGALFPYADKTLTKVMAGLNVASIDSMKISAVAGSKDEQIANLILDGEAKLADEEMKAAWLLNQSEAYFYSQVLPNKVMENINASIDSHAKDHFYTKAIEEAKAAKAYFGNTPELNKKVTDLIVARSEFILFSTVTEQSVFDKQKLHDSLSDLERNAPKKFGEITDLLESMARDSIDKSHQLSRPARGAIAVERALRDYLAEGRS